MGVEERRRVDLHQHFFTSNSFINLHFSSCVLDLGFLNTLPIVWSSKLGPVTSNHVCVNSHPRKLEALPTPLQVLY